ncbi:MAG: outer membrane beta-barrel protein [Bacteroidetes bacterium]|nr:outer membrane beta-barrel protein [Bacteroidota bacterium]
MKTKLTIITLLLAASAFTKAQEIPTAPTKPADEKKQKDRIIGIGLKSSNLLNDLLQSQYEYVMPAGNRIVVTINAHPNFRIQPEVGYFQTKSYNKYLKEDLVNKSFAYGAGMYGMWQKEKTNLYAGLKYIASKNSDEGVQQTTTYNPNPPYNTITTYNKTTATFTNSAVGLVLGGEYFLSGHFSVGTEVGLLRTKSNADYPSGSYYQEEDYASTSITTETNLLVRFYF